jgi:hypothetical protein
MAKRGRKPLNLTPEQKAERKQRWWGPERNLRRRARYRHDPEYREQVLGYVRRQTNNPTIGTIKPPTEVTDLRRVMLELPNIGVVRTVIVGDRTIRMLTFNRQEMAIIMSKSANTLGRWIKEGLFPAPKSRAITSAPGPCRLQVYTAPEVRAMLQVILTYHDTDVDYRPSSDKLTNELFGAYEVAHQDRINHEIPESELAIPVTNEPDTI